MHNGPDAISVSQKNRSRTRFEDEDFTIELPDKSIEVDDDASDRFHEAIANEKSLCS